MSPHVGGVAGGFRPGGTTVRGGTIYYTGVAVVATDNRAALWRNGMAARRYGNDNDNVSSEMRGGYVFYSLRRNTNNDGVGWKFIIYNDILVAPAVLATCECRHGRNTCGKATMYERVIEKYAKPETSGNNNRKKKK